MTPGRDLVHPNGHGRRDSAEAEALLNETWLSTPDDGLSVSSSAGSMTSRIKTSWSAHKPLTNHLDDGPELALGPLTNSTELDNAQLRAQGHEVALERRFSPLAALGLGFRYSSHTFHEVTHGLICSASITNSWVGYLSNFGQNLIYGGPQNVVFGLLVATAVQWTITLGLSEVASAFPSSGVSSRFLISWLQQSR